MCLSDEVVTAYKQTSKHGEAAEEGLWRNVSSEH